MNLPLKKANICTKNAVLVGVAALNTHFLLVTYEKRTANTHASAFAISSLIPKNTLKMAYDPMLITKVILLNNPVSMSPLSGDRKPQIRF